MGCVPPLCSNEKGKEEPQIEDVAVRHDGHLESKSLNMILVYDYFFWGGDLDDVSKYELNCICHYVCYGTMQFR